MALASFADLAGAVPNWLARPGDIQITANVGDFVTLCEQRIHMGAPEGSPFPSRPLRVRGMETERVLILPTPTNCGTATGIANAIMLTPAQPVASLTKGLLVNFTAVDDNTGATTITVAGTGDPVIVVIGSALLPLSGGEITGGGNHQAYFDGGNFILLPSGGTCPLPPGHLGERSFFIPGTPRIDLEYVPPDQLNATRTWDAITGCPRRYTIEADAIRFDPQPDAMRYAAMLYYKRLPSLEDASTNWLMTNGPAIYLYGTLLEAAVFIGDDTQVSKWGSAYKTACDGLVAADSSDRHAGGSLVIRNLSGNP